MRLEPTQLAALPCLRHRPFALGFLCPGIRGKISDLAKATVDAVKRSELCSEMLDIIYPRFTCGVRALNAAYVCIYVGSEGF